MRCWLELSGERQEILKGFIMPDEIVTQQESALTTSVRDVTEELSLVALNIDQMKVAQVKLANWFRSKMQILGADLGEVEAELKIAAENGWRVTLFKSQIVRLKKRIEYYEKCALASEAGYCLIPNLPCELFAVRMNRGSPRQETSTRAHVAATVRSDSPPAGLGEYVDDAAAIRERSIMFASTVTPGKMLHDHFEFWPTAFNEEIDFPMSICKPAIMNETARAMALKVFDEMAVVDDSVRNPGVSASASKAVRKGDPLVIGIIRNPDRKKYDDKRVTFLIGWHVDTRTL